MSSSIITDNNGPTGHTTYVVILRETTHEGERSNDANPNSCQPKLKYTRDKQRKKDWSDRTTMPAGPEPEISSTQKRTVAWTLSYIVQTYPFTAGYTPTLRLSNDVGTTQRTTRGVTALEPLDAGRLSADR